MTKWFVPDTPELPEELPADLRELLSQMAWWLQKSMDGFKPPEVATRTAAHVATCLELLSKNRQAPWPADPWLRAHPSVDDDGGAQ